MICFPSFIVLIMGVKNMSPLCVQLGWALVTDGRRHHRPTARLFIFHTFKLCVSLHFDVQLSSCFVVANTNGKCWKKCSVVCQPPHHYKVRSYLWILNTIWHTLKKLTTIMYQCKMTVFILSSFLWFRNVSHKDDHSEQLRIDWTSGPKPCHRTPSHSSLEYGVYTLQPAVNTFSLSPEEEWRTAAQHTFWRSLIVSFPTDVKSSHCSYRNTSQLDLFI